MSEGAGKRVPGGCLCGGVRLEVELPTLFCAHCHCGMCRRAHGAGFVTWFAVPEERLHFVRGRERLRAYRSSEHGRRSFCEVCGSTLLCESSHMPGVVDVVLACLEGPIDRPPERHFFFSDRADWVAVADDLPRHGGKSGTEPL